MRVTGSPDFLTKHRLRPPPPSPCAPVSATPTAVPRYRTAPRPVQRKTPKRQREGERSRGSGPALQPEDGKPGPGGGGELT